EFGADYKFFSPSILSNFTWGAAQREINSLTAKNSFIVLQADSSFDGSTLKIKDASPIFGQEISVQDTGFDEGFRNSRPLLVSDTPFTGLYVPKSFGDNRSLVSRYLPNSSGIIAPTAKSDDKLLLSIICSMFLKEDKGPNGRILFGTLGDRYKNARNNFVEFGGGAESSLLSYNLYGLPFASVGLKRPFDGTEIQMFCGQFAQKNTVAATEVISLSANAVGAQADTQPNSFTKTISLDFSDYSVEDVGNNLQVLAIGGTQQNLSFGAPVLPFAVKETRFPLSTIVSNIELSGKSNPVDLQIPNIAGWDGNGFVPRYCGDSNSLTLVFAPLFTEDKEIVVAKIFPVESLDCNAGLFRLWQNVEYKVDYSPFSPVLLDSVSVPIEVLPNQAVQLKASAENISTSDLNESVIVSSRPLNSKQWFSDIEPVKEASFETTSKWASGRYNNLDVVFNGVTSEWSTDGSHSWKFSENAPSGSGFLVVQQELDFTNIDAISFDYRCESISRPSSE
ncbi:MAG: hypothetical protein AABW85_02580, partial [archaeon]